MKKNRLHIVLLTAAMLLTFLLPFEASAASTKTVYVITSQTWISPSGSKSKDWMTYNKYGLVDRYGSGSYYSSYSYDENGKMCGSDLVRDSKGRIIEDYSSGEDTDFKYDKQGNVRSYVKPNGVKTTCEYNKKNQMIKETTKGLVNKDIKYDKNGNIKSYTVIRTTNGKKKVEYNKIKNVYKNGRLVECRYKVKQGKKKKYKKDWIYKYTYRKMTVPAQMVKLIKAQQKYFTLGLCPCFKAQSCTAY